MRHHQDQGGKRQGGVCDGCLGGRRDCVEPEPYAGNWMAKGTADATVTTIRIDNKERVWVNGKRVKAKRSDGALVFRDGFITYTVQGDRRLKGEDYWSDSDAKSKGPIVSE